MFLGIGITIISLVVLAGGTFYATQEKIIFHPIDLPQDYHYSFKSEFEELFLKSGDGVINALYFKIKNPKGVILYFHGNSGSLDTWGGNGEIFTQTGYDFLIFDYRGYGKSTGHRSEEEFHADGQMLYDYLKKSYPEDKIVLYGRSLGSGFATKLASNNNPKALILETPYYNFKSVAQHHFPFLPISLILRWKIRTDQWISHVKCPVLIFHGTKDEVIPYKQSIQLKNLLKKEDTFVTLEGATHNNITTFPEYHQYLNKYIE